MTTLTTACISPPTARTATALDTRTGLPAPGSSEIPGEGFYRVR